MNKEKRKKWENLNQNDNIKPVRANICRVDLSFSLSLTPFYSFFRLSFSLTPHLPHSFCWSREWLFATAKYLQNFFYPLKLCGERDTSDQICSSQYLHEQRKVHFWRIGNLFSHHTNFQRVLLNVFLMFFLSVVVVIVFNGKCDYPFFNISFCWKKTASRQIFNVK
jgi:hypothetical protein